MSEDDETRLLAVSLFVIFLLLVFLFTAVVLM